MGQALFLHHTVPAMMLCLPKGSEATEPGDHGQKPFPLLKAVKVSYFDDCDEKLLNTLWKMPLIGQEAGWIEAMRTGFGGNEQTAPSSKSRPHIYEMLVKKCGCARGKKKKMLEAEGQS